MGLINDSSYCDYTDSFNVAYPSNIDSAMNVLSDYNSDGLAREIFKTHGNDVMPDNVHKDMNETEFNQVRNTNRQTVHSIIFVHLISPFVFDLAFIYCSSKYNDDIHKESQKLLLSWIQ